MSLRCPLALLAAFVLAVPVAQGQAKPPDFTVKVIALNDFHGNLESPGTFSAGPGAPMVPAGGIAYLAGYVEYLAAQNPDHVVVSAGDLTGGGPLLSALFHDESTIETMNRLGLDLNAVGNHEFDKGRAELLRRQSGGCSTTDANTCKGAEVGTPVPFEGARFQYLAANVFDTASGKTIFPAYAIRTFHGVRIAFIGLTLTGTPDIVLPAGVAGLRFTGEADAINANVRELQKQGIRNFIVLLHQGGSQSGRSPYDINACFGDLADTPILPIVAQLDDAVDLVITAHTHQPYICHLPNRAGRRILVTSASSYGRLLTDIDLTIGGASGKITAIAARNLVVDRTNPAIHPDLAIQGIVDRYAALAAPIVNRVVGTISATISKTTVPSGESPLGDLIADAQLAATSSPATGGAVIAFMNEDGIRTDLSFTPPIPGLPAGSVTYGELFGAQPFRNNLVTMTVTGEQIKTLLEEQFKGCTLGAPPGTTPSMTRRILEVSAGLTYTWSAAAPECAKVVPASLKLNGKPILPAARYRITVNSLLADGGAEFHILTQGTRRTSVIADIDATAAYLAHHPAIAPLPPSRITLEP